MTIDKNNEKIVKRKDGCYLLEGDLTSDESISIDLDGILSVSGNIIVGGSITWQKMRG